MNDYQSILACVDLSPASKQIILRAKELADQYTAHLIVLYVNEDMPPINEPFGEPPSLVFDQDLRLLLEKRSKEQLDELTKETQLSELVPVEFINGHPKTTILEYADKHNIDLIVIGRHKHPAILDILGSTANSIMHKASCDILMVNRPSSHEAVRE